jgi:hypothetical protein
VIFIEHAGQVNVIRLAIIKFSYFMLLNCQNKPDKVVHASNPSTYRGHSKGIVSLRPTWAAQQDTTSKKKLEQIFNYTLIH